LGFLVKSCRVAAPAPGRTKIRLEVSGQHALVVTNAAAAAAVTPWLDQSSGSSGRTEGAAAARCKARIPKTIEVCVFPEGGQHVKLTTAFCSKTCSR